MGQRSSLYTILIFFDFYYPRHLGLQYRALGFLCVHVCVCVDRQNFLLSSKTPAELLRVILLGSSWQEQVAYWITLIGCPVD